MSGKVKISSKNQIAVPAEVRKQLGVGPGDSLLFEVVDGELILLPEPKDWAKYMRGLHKEIWAGIDVDKYIQEERDSWGDSPID